MSEASRTERAAFLGVERSLTGKRWAARLGDERLALAIAQRHGLPDAISRLLAARDVDLDSVADFLEPTLRKFLPDPSHLKDMDEAVARLVRAVPDGRAHRRIRRLRRRWCHLVGAAAALLPRRRRQHRRLHPGPPQGRLRAQRAGAAEDRGRGRLRRRHGRLRHHRLRAAGRGQARRPRPHRDRPSHGGDRAARARSPWSIPNRIDDSRARTSISPRLALPSCSWSASTARCATAGWYGELRPEPDLRQWLGLVALGTVCDVVPLLGVNRALVKAGLQVMAQRRNAGLSALADVARLKEAPEAYHLGFLLGPEGQRRRSRRPGRSRRAPAVERRSARGRRTGHPARRIQRRAPRHRARGARPGDHPDRGPVRGGPHRNSRRRCWSRVRAGMSA